jgi:hypothetical protein
MSIEFKQIVNGVLNEGEGLEGFDLPPRYPIVKGNIFKKILFPGSVYRGTKNRYWYIECTPSSSNSWAVNRAAAAQLKRNGVQQSEITRHLFRFIRDNSPTVKVVSSDAIPDNESNVVLLRAR